MKSSYTEHELSLIAELRTLVADILEDSYEESNDFLITWLQYANFDIKKAEEALRKSKTWRIQNDMDKILHEDMKEIAEEYPIETWCVDKDGSPILALKCEKHQDFRKVVNTPGGKPRLVRYLLRNCEQIVRAMKKQNAKTNGRVTKFSGVVDLEGFSYSQVASTKVISAITELARTAEDNYPGVIKTLYVLNAPRIFKVLLNILKPFLSEDTLSRVRIINGSPKEIRKTLLEYISEDELPSFVK